MPINIKPFLPFLSIFSPFYILSLSSYSLLVVYILKQWGLLRGQEVRVEGNKSISRLGLGALLCVSPPTHTLSAEMVSRQQILRHSKSQSNKAFRGLSHFKSSGGISTIQREFQVQTLPSGYLFLYNKLP